MYRGDIGNRNSQLRVRYRSCVRHREVQFTDRRVRDVPTTPVQLERTHRYLGVQGKTHDMCKSRYVLNEHGDF